MVGLSKEEQIPTEKSIVVVVVVYDVRDDNIANCD